MLSILKNIYNIYVLVWFLSASQGAIAGIVSAVVATVIGAVSSFIAYQKKKLCFKQSDEENVNMESHRGAQSEPPVQRTLLEN